MAAEISAEMHEFHAKLKKIGWNISIEEIKGCIQELGQRDRTVENIAKWALNCDLKEIGLKVLTDEVKRGQVKLVEGPLVLQIQKIRNISAPKVNEESGAAPRLLKLQLTDGHTTCFALEHSLIQKLSLSTPPGTKIRLKGTVPLLCGFMLLESRQVEVLGGKVEKLIVKWETHKSVSKQRANPGLPSDDGPPLFIAFDPKTSSVVKRTAASKPGHQNTNNSFSTQESNFNKKDDNKKENVAFEHSREQRILTAKHQRQSNPTQSESKTSSGHQVPGYQRNQQHSSSDGNEKRVGEDLAVKASGTKQQAFGPNKSNVRDAKFSDKDNGEKYVKKDSYARRPGSHKGGRHNDDISDEYSTSKPSEGTLWDFLETKLPSKGSKTENVKPMHSTVDRVEKGENQNNRQPSSQRDSQYRGPHENQQQQEKGNLRKGGHLDIRDGHRGNQDVHRQHERSGQVRNKKVLDEHKKSDHSRNQARSQQKQDHQIQDRYVDQHKKTAEGSSSQNSKEKKQVPEKKDDKDNNRRNDTRFHIKSQQPEVKYNNQSGKSTKGSGRQDNQREDNYRKDFPKYDQKAEGSESTYKITRGEDRAVNYRTKDHKGKKGGGVLTDQNDRQGEIEQNVHVNKKEAGMGNKSVQQSHGKPNEHYAATPRRDVQQYKEHADLSKKEKYNAAKKTVNNHHRDQSERYEERRLGDPRNESRKQHWWKEGEDCMAFRAEHRQYYLARIMKVEVRSRSCAVIFHDTGRQEVVNWSNLFPLDMQASNDNTFQFHESPSPYPSTAPQDRYIQQAPSFTPGHHAIQASEMRQRSQRPTQAFYRPPMRGTKE